MLGMRYKWRVGIGTYDGSERRKMETEERKGVNSRAFPLRRPPFSGADFDFGVVYLV